MAPSTLMGVSPENGGSGLASLPQISMAAVRRASEAPTVAMICASTPLESNGLMASCWNTADSMATMTTAPTNATPSGSPAP